jgi:adenylate cyclase
MLWHYRAQAWEEALTHLGRCKAISRIAHLSRLLDIYSLRINGFLSSPPPPDWDGVFDAQP